MRRVLAILGGLGAVGSVWGAEPMQDFRLVDANPNSARFGQTVSPRDYRLQISAYYFGYAS
jgi:hypothetical protein